ncbi:hypothetical protein D0861_03905 [Lecanosticta acicola]|uniref:non-specific serine/threonine protein kinase n=1 Tax=Lecanosticta acicola TaxID=111012 RepID=A0AAI8Z4I3_9PEZI|nr:hypothetical protein D0861_03905 [Lecanosticta acicola]
MSESRPDAVFIGGYGTASVWLKADRYGKIIDRMAIKDTAFEHWTSQFWNSDFTMPNEVSAMYRLRPLRGSENVVRIRNWRMNKPQKRHRIYMEFCPFGSLRDVIVPHRRQGGRPPVPFAWKFFEDLVVAGILMERGDMHCNTLGNWSLLVHRDLKPDNIFLANNNSAEFRGYPKAKVGDWGLCVILSPDDKRTTRAFGLASYQYNVPKELVNPNLHGAASGTNPQRLTSKSNVWQVAMVVWCYMKCEPNGDWDLRAFDYATRREPADFNAQQRMHYGAALCDLVMECLAYLPEERPSFDRILKQIRRHTTSGRNDGAGGLRLASADDRRFGKYGLLLRKERYPLRSMLQDELRAEDIDGHIPPAIQHGPGDSDSSHSSDDFGGPAGASMVFPGLASPRAPNISPVTRNL